MPEIKEDKDREHRIQMEIVIDAYNEEEKAMGWYYYLEDKINFPFLAKCLAKRAISPLNVGDEIQVIGMAPGEECMHEMFVAIRWEKGDLAVPLAQLQPDHSDNQTREAVEDWHYWVKRGYQF